MKILPSEKRKLFDALSASHPLKFSEAGLEDDFPSLAPVLKKAGFLRPDQPGLETICPALPNNCLVTAHPSNGRYYVHCECSEEVGLVQIDPKELRRFRFDLNSFMNWLISASTTESDLKEIESGRLWRLGEKSLKGETAKVYFIRSKEAEESEGLLRSLRKDETPLILFWLGETPHGRQFPPNLVSLPEIINIIGKEFTLDRKPLEHLLGKRLVATVGGDLVLDRDIALRKEGEKRFLLLKRGQKNAFQVETRIRPLDYRIIRHLYQIRRYQNRARSLAEMRDRGLAEHRPSISRSIKTVNELCEKHDVPSIFHKFPEQKWGLNPSLDCCNER